MANDYFTETGDPAANTRLRSSPIRALFTAIGDAFDKLSGLTGNGGKLQRINAGATAQESMAFGTANQVLGMNNGATAYEHKTLTGTTNQITITHGANSVTYSLPQNIHTGASPTFAGMTLTSLTVTSVTINGGTITGITDLAIADGGTGASTAGDARTNLGLAIGSDVQAYDADLSAVAALSSTGMIVRTGSGTAEIRTMAAPAAGLTITNPGGVAGNPTFALANDLAAVEGLSGAGMAARTGSDTWEVRTITAPAAGITVSNGDGVSGNPTLALANDLAGVEGLSSTGMAARTGDGTWAARTLTAGSGVTVTNGNGVSGNPTIAVTPGIGTGDVIGPAGATGDRVVLFDGVTGKLLKDSGLTLSGTNTGDETTTTLGATINAAGAATPNDTDLFAVAEAGGVVKKLLLSTLKTTLGFVTNILGSAAGGTGNGFTKFSGPTTSEKTFTLPDASASLAILGAETWTGDKTLAENVGIVLDAALSADGKYSGIVQAGTSAAALAFGEVCYRVTATGKWNLARAAAADVGTVVATGQLGMCVLAAAGADAATTMLLFGKVRADALFDTFTVGAPVYLSAATAGKTVSAAPTGTTDFTVRKLGFAEDANTVYFSPSPDYITLA